MGWDVASALLVGVAALGGLLGWALPRVRAWMLVLLLVATAFVLFLPGVCATAIASQPGTPVDVDSSTTCWTSYGARLPGLGGNDTVGGFLAPAGAAAGVTSLLLVRRRRRS
jgi:hypothetical protein